MILRLIFVQIFYSCLTFCGATAIAAPYLPLTEPRFLSPTKNLEIKPILNASFSADFPAENCTGTFISNQGHFLTADHCIQSCLVGMSRNQYSVQESEENGIQLRIGAFRNAEGQVFNETRSYKVIGSAMGFTIRRLFSENMPDNILCGFKLNGIAKRARLIVSGKGRLYPFNSNQAVFRHMTDQTLKDLFLEFEKSGAGYPQGDFAILQLIEKPTTPCLQLSDRTVVSDEPLRAVSYTCISTPSKKNNLSGDLALYTEGVPATPKMFLNADNTEKSVSTTYPDTFFSFLDAETCSSGSSVVDSKNRIVGIMSLLTEKRSKNSPNLRLVHLLSSKAIISAIHQRVGHDLNCI